MGDNVDNYHVGEHLTVTSGAATSQGWGVTWGQASAGTHKWSQPDLTRAALDDLITSAKNNTQPNFSDDAEDEWGSWCTSLGSVEQARVWKVLNETGL